MVHVPLRLRMEGDALVANWRWLAARSGRAACGAAVKADGYGLGAAEVARRLAEAGCRDFFVATWAEAAALQPLADGLSLSVLHGVGRDDVDLPPGVRPVLNSPEQIERWRGKGPCDVMIDTGINRLGLASAQGLEGLEIHTLMSHLACADEDSAFNIRQRDDFAALVGRTSAQRISLANSAGIALGPDY
ncbi:alanine racemase, partial [Allosphingosinicella sp.]|uniref:alanine racemase n=1 Tax=Allosphingosinicella sp. TaxID=2823234 RepID=UPI002F18EF41